MGNKFVSITLILSLLLSLMAVPAFAMTVDDFSDTYAEKIIDNNFDTETGNADAPDGSTGYKTITEETDLWSGTNVNYISEFLASMDFRFDNEDATMTIKNSKATPDIGPSFSYSTDSKGNGIIRNQKGGSSYDTLANIELNSWYNMELQGKVKSDGANLVFRLYKWENGEKILVKVVKGINLRNFSAGSSKGNPTRLVVTSGISVDNEFFASLYPDTINVVPAVGDVTEIKGGETLKFNAVSTINYEMSEGDEAVVCTAPNYEWDLYDENGVNPLLDDDISIQDGELTVKNTVAEQSITVRATADTKGKPYGEYKVKINAVDTSNDKYDKLIVSADKSYVRVDEPLTITAKATMGGMPVELTDEDVLWSIYNETNIREIQNTNITIKNGVLSVTESVVPQNITVRAVNPSGSITSTYPVYVRPANMNIEGEADYTDTFASANACEEAPQSGAVLEEGSWDGSSYYKINDEYAFAGFGANTTRDVIYSADVKFAEENSGTTIQSTERKVGMQLRRQGTKLGVLGSGDKFNPYLDIDADSWYNIQIMCSTCNGDGSYAHLILYKYDENGNKVNPQDGTLSTPFVQKDITMRNLASDKPGCNMVASIGSCIDNVLSMYIAPDNFSIALDVSTVLAGNTAQATATASRQGIAFPKLNGELIKYEIYDSDDRYPFENDNITIDSNGKITVSSMAEAQEVYVRVKSVTGDIHSSAKLTIVSSDIFEIQKIALNEEGTKVVALDVNKIFAYDKEVTFVLVTYDENMVMQSVNVKSAYGSDIPEGVSTVPMNCELKNFDKDKDTLKVFTWTKLS